MKLTRRKWLGLGLGAGAVALGGRWTAVAATEQARGGKPMNLAEIPSSGQQVPAVGLGTVDFQGNPDTDDLSQLRQTLEVFHRLGGRLLDTSPNYGNSENVLSALLGDLGTQGDMFMATKVDREDRAAGEQRMEESFQRLGGAVDLMQVHNLRGADVVLPALVEWKQQGRFKYIGITTHRDSQHGGIEEYMRRYPLDFVQVNYSLADRAAADRILPLALDKGIAVLVNRPFGKGGLFGAVRGKQLPDWAADIDCNSWGQVFLKYIMGHPAVTIPIPGTSKPHHAEDNAGALYGRLPDASLRLEMERWLDRLG
jgi:aryl-alcohol dehydrogenase-like predicted oxidoreductase